MIRGNREKTKKAGPSTMEGGGIAPKPKAHKKRGGGMSDKKSLACPKRPSCQDASGKGGSGRWGTSRLYNSQRSPSKRGHALITGSRWMGRHVCSLKASLGLG